MSWLINKAVEDYIDRFNKGEIKLEFRPPNPDIQKFIDELPDMVL